MNVGSVRARPSSRALNEAIALLNAVGGSDKTKLDALNEIKQAQDAYERVINQSKADRKLADQMLAKAKADKAEADKAKAEVAKAQGELKARTDALRAEINERVENATRKERAVDARVREVDEREKKAKELTAQAEALKRSLEAELNKARESIAKSEATTRKHEQKLARLIAVANEK